MTSAASLELGYGRKLIREFLQHENNMIVFTEQTAMTEKSFGQHILAGNNSILD